MKLIQKLKIQGETWKVYLKDMGPDLDGECLFSERVININQNLDAKAKSCALIHELGHSICHELGIHMTAIHPDVIELLVDAYAKAIITNKKQVKKMLE